MFVVKPLFRKLIMSGSSFILTMVSACGHKFVVAVVARFRSLRTVPNILRPFQPRSGWLGQCLRPIREEECIWKKKNTKQNKSYLQHKACLRIKTESPNAYYDTLCICTNVPTPRPSPLSLTVFTQLLVSGHVYEVNMAIAIWSPFLSIRKSKYQRDIASKMKQLCYLIRTLHSSKSLGGTDYFLRWNRRGEFEH